MINPERKSRFAVVTAGAAESLPPICNLTAQRNSVFTGRSETLATLADNFFSGPEPASAQVIKGMGGIGKTQIALEFSYRFSRQYDVIWWVRAENDLVLVEDYTSFAWAVDLADGAGGSEKQLIGAIRHWLGRNRKWLFVFDNAKHPDQLLDYLPEENAGNTLITSRHQMWEKLCPSTGLLYFSRDESVDFLLKRTQRDDRLVAGHVAEKLIDFPLALELAAGIINAANIGFSTFAMLFSRQHQALWEDKKPPRTYPDTMGSIVSLALEKVEKEAPSALLIVNLFAYLSEDEISSLILNEVQRYFRAHFPSLFPETETFEKAVATLVRYSLVSKGDGTLSIHHLVQAVLRDRLDVDEHKKWSGTAVAVIDRVFPSETYQQSVRWPDCAALLSHGRCAVRHALEHQTAHAEAADLLASLGSYLQSRAFFTKAEPIFTQALDLFEKQVGPKHPHVGAVVHHLAALHQDQGRYETAEALFRRALDIYRTALGEDHLYVGSICNHLAALLRTKGNDTEAESFFRSALDIFQHNLAATHPQIATSLNNLAVMLQDQGKYVEAEQLLHSALENYQGASAEDHPFTATAMTNLAQLYRDLGKVDDAVHFLRKALAIREAHFPSDHPAVYTTMMELADALGSAGEHEEAEEIYRTILNHCEKKQDGDRLQLASCSIHLAKLMQQRGSHGEAETLFRKGLRIQQAQLSANHPDVASGMTGLASTLHDQDKFTEAESLYRTALQSYESHPDVSRPEIAMCLNNLAVLLYDQGKFADAEPFLRQSVQMNDDALGADHPDAITCRYNLSELLKNMGKTEEAEKLLLQIPTYFSKETF